MNVRDEFLPAAVELLNEFGISSTLTRRSSVTRAPTASMKFDRTARTAPEEVIVITTLAVVTPQKRTDIATGVVTTRSIALMLDEPVQGDTLTLGGTTYKVGEVTVIAPQGQAIYYEAEVS
jgi:hypothetical protein